MPPIPGLLMRVGTVTDPRGLSKLNAFALDDLPAAATRGYSTRKLRRLYSGPCMRVRRGTDNAETNIGFAAGVIDSAALLDFVGTGTGYVVTWYDQTGNLDLTQTSTAAQPTIFAGGAINPDGVRFNGTSQYLVAASAGLWAAGKASVLAVVNGPSWVAGVGSATGQLFGETNSTATNGRYLPLSRGNAAAQIAAYVLSDTGTSMASPTKDGIFNGANHQVSVIDTGTTIAVYGDNASAGPAAYTRSGPITADRTVMGARVHSGGPANYYQGGIREVLAFTVAITDDIRLQLQTSQKSRFGTP